MEQLEVNGHQPTLEGLKCEAFIVSQFWYQGLLEDPANTISMKFDGHWHRLYFNYGTIFWRSSNESRPKAFSMPEHEGEFRLDDIGESLGLVGAKLLAITSCVIEGGSEVVFLFEGEKKVTFSSINDVTTYEVKKST